MLLRVFKSKQIYNLFLIPILGILFWMKAFLSPETFEFFPGEDQMPLFSLLAILVGNSVMTGKIVAFIAEMVLVFLVIRLSTLFGFLRTRSYLPGIIYIILVGGFPSLLFFHPVFPGTIFLLLSIYYLFDAYNKNEILENCFITGFILSVGSLFYFPLVIFIPLLIAGFLFLARMYQWRHFLLPLVGFATPWLITISAYYLTDSAPQLFAIISNNTYENNPIEVSEPVKYYSFLVMILAIISGLFLIKYYDTKKISSRKYLAILTFFLAITASIPWMINSAAIETVLILLIPAAYYVTHFLLFFNSRFWTEVILYLLLISSFIVQFLN